MWTRTLLKNKSRALLIHVGISSLIFIPFLYLIWFRWFPPPMFFSDGGWQGVRIMLFVDVVIGPTLTFLIFNPAKSLRETLFDFTCIGLVQAAALVYGYVNVESKRVFAVTFFEYTFRVVPKDVFSAQLIGSTDWTRLGERAPYWVYVRKPESDQEKSAAQKAEAEEGKFHHELPFLYEPLSAHWPEVAQFAVSWPKSTTQPEFAPLCADFAESAALPALDLSCIGFHGYFRPAVVIFDQDGRRLGYEVGRYPWD